MNKKNCPTWSYIAIIALVAILAGVLIWYMQPAYVDDTSGIIINPQITNADSIVNTGEDSTDTAIEDLIVSSPTSQDKVGSPLIITGEASGLWFFEAVMPVEILDANDDTIVNSYVTAEGDWMTDSLVPFSGTVEFNTPATETGWLVFKASNPSGLEENSKAVRLPITF